MIAMTTEQDVPYGVDFHDDEQTREWIRSANVLLTWFSERDAFAQTPSGSRHLVGGSVGLGIAAAIDREVHYPHTDRRH